MSTAELPPQIPLPARYAVLIDVGYLYAAAGAVLLGAGSRRQYRVEAEKLIHALQGHAAELLRGELLRVYWYDAARDRVPTIDQRVIAQLPWVKLRLGNLNVHGQQKGVDAQIRSDLETLARHRAVTDAILLAGDEDMLPAVEAAQAYGVRVHLWGIEPPYGTNQAERLVWESDTVEELDTELIRPYFALNEVETVDSATATVDAAEAEVVPSPADVFGALQHAKARTTQAAAAVAAKSRLGPGKDQAESAGKTVAHKWILTRGRDNIRDLLPGPILPAVIDKELLTEAEKELGQSLRSYQEARAWLRNGFWSRVYQEFGLTVGRSDG